MSIAHESFMYLLVVMAKLPLQW